MRSKAKIVTINKEQKLYVIENSYGYTCLGFRVTQKRSEAIAKWLGIELRQHRQGTKAHYDAYTILCEAAQAKFERTGERCPAELTPALIGLEGKRVEVVNDRQERRRFIVGKSTGWMPCHLEVARRNSTGGPAVFNDFGSRVYVVGQGRY